MKTTSLLVGTALLLNTCAPLSALGQCSCCSQASAPSSGQNLGLNTQKSVLNSAVQTVVENYLVAQTALANDSLDKVPASARIMAKAVRADTAHTLPPQVAVQADLLARSRNLPAARKAFQVLSTSLIQHLKAGTVPSGEFYEVYCPMAKASWLQTGPSIRNPYFGQTMLNCGQIKTAEPLSVSPQAETAAAPATTTSPHMH